MTAVVQSDDIGAWLDMRNESFGVGYRLGFAAGDEVGYGRCMHDLYDGSVVHRFRLGPLDVSQTELLQRRCEVGQLCQQFAERHGRPYEGGAVDWVTGQPLRRSA